MEISIEHLNKNYGKQNVLKDISLHIPIGMYGMLGENGAGKTTLMRILATLSEPTTGMVEINGIDIKRKKEIRKIIGYLPQEFSIYPNMTVYSALDYLGILTELPNNIRKRRINELLKQVNLEHEKNKRFKNLSGGMKRRFGIAQALLNDPKILIIDEPTAGLDPEERLRFYNLLSELAVERIILLSTHIASDIEATCSKAAVLSSGTVVFEGQIEKLLQLGNGKVYTTTILQNELNQFKLEEDTVEKLKDIIVDIRNTRANMNVHPSKKTKLIFVTSEYEEAIKQANEFLIKLGFATDIETKNEKNGIPENAIAILKDGIELYIPFEELVDIKEEIKRLEVEISKLESEVARCNKMLSNPGFINKAPESKINEEKEKLAKYEEMLNASKERLEKIRK